MRLYHEGTKNTKVHKEELDQAKDCVRLNFGFIADDVAARPEPWTD
jgi:hypothetical protein